MVKKYHMCEFGNCVDKWQRRSCHHTTVLMVCKAAIPDTIITRYLNSQVHS